MSFKKLVQFGLLVAFGSDSASHHSVLVKPAQLSAAAWDSPSLGVCKRDMCFYPFAACYDIPCKGYQIPGRLHSAAEQAEEA